MIYYWIESQHSGKVLDVEKGSLNIGAKIIQCTKKSVNDPTVDSQLWYSNGVFITNKNSDLVIDVCGAKYKNGTQITQYKKREPNPAQEWVYDCESNTISLRSNQNLVLNVANGSEEDSAPIILYEKNGLPHQKFILRKCDDVLNSNTTTSITTNIIDHNKFLPKLSQNFLEILDDDEYYDVNIEVGNDPHVKIFHAHTNILYYRSPYLKRILSTNEKKNDGTLLQIKLPNILPEIFQIILRYIYGGRLSLKEYDDTSEIIKILVAAGELSLYELITHLQYFLIKNKENWMEQNFDLIHKISFENDSFLELQKYCLDLISKYPDKIFKSSNFSSIPENLLLSLIQNDNLQMKEAQIWEYVIKWGLAQNSELSSDPTNYSKNDFITLKNTLQQCIPLIDFYNLTSKEFSDKVLPYRKIFPKELFMNLLKDFLNNDSKPVKPVKESEKQIKEFEKQKIDGSEKQIKESIPLIADNKKIIETRSNNNIDSKIITFQHVEIISKWIKRLKISEKFPSSCEFRLLFRASRDGFHSEKFHEICDYQSHTVTIVKVKGSDEILGGYNPIEWKSSDTRGVTNDSLFSLLRIIIMII